MKRSAPVIRSLVSQSSHSAPSIARPTLCSLTHTSTSIRFQYSQGSSSNKVHAHLIAAQRRDMSAYVHPSTKGKSVDIPSYGKLAYHDYNPSGTPVTSKDGKTLTLLCTHGFLVNSTLWSKTTPLFVDKGFRVIVPDLPLGAHLYPLSENADLTPPGLGKLLSDFITKAGLENVILVGNDTGGAVCQMAITHHPNSRITGLVLTDCDVYDYFLPPMFAPLIALAGWTPGLYHLRLTGTLGKIRMIRYVRWLCGYLVKYRDPGSETDKILYDYFDYISQASWDVLRDVKKVVRGIDNKYTLEAAATKFGGFDKKVLLAWCPEDKAFVDKFVPRLVEDFGGKERVSVQPIPDSYTFSMLDQPAALTNAVANWVKVNF